MPIVVSILGALIAILGLVGLVRPSSLAAVVEYWPAPRRFWSAVIVRLVVGTVFLFVAPFCRLPVVIQAFGILGISAAVVLFLLGKTRFDALIAWWLQGSVRLRCSAVFAIALGVLLAYAGAGAGA